MNTYFAENNKRYVFLDGRALRDISLLYDELQSQLSFPDYFGRNLDGLEEMFYDLEWIEEESIWILIYHVDMFLSAEDVELKEIVLDILKSPDFGRLNVKEISFQ